MPYFLSTPDLITGNKFLDTEHANMIQLIDALIAACDNGASLGTVRLHMGHLMDFAREHFQREESAMARTAFGLREAHVQDHARLLRDIAALRQQLDTDQPMDCAHTYHFMRSWLRQHILEFDIPMVAEKQFDLRPPAAPG
jgi:hemerythrin